MVRKRILKLRPDIKYYLLGILFVVLIIPLGISLANLTISHTQEDTNDVVAGCFSMFFDDEHGESVDLTNTYPMSDASGLNTNPYTFTISNTCTLTGLYYITLDIVDSITTLPLSSIKVSLTGDVDVSPRLITDLGRNIDIYQPLNIRSSHIIAIDFLEPESEPKEYSLRIWIDEAAGNEVMNKDFEARLTVTSVAKKGDISIVDPGVPAQSWNYEYTGDFETFTAPRSGEYIIELWGASGGDTTVDGGPGAYTKGKITLAQNQDLFVYVGQHRNDNVAAWNGGAIGALGPSTYEGTSGGGATDVRVTSGTWDNIASLRSRIMVASGGGGSSNYFDSVTGGAGGALTGLTGLFDVEPITPDYPSAATGGTQTSGGGAGSTESYFGAAQNGSFGIGGAAGDQYGPSGGGGGYYGGGGGGIGGYVVGSGAGGSSYISGYTGCVAITSAADSSPKGGCASGTSDPTCSHHYSGKIFTETVMKAGNESFLDPEGVSETGHAGDGYARITLLGSTQPPEPPEPELPDPPTFALTGPFTTSGGSTTRVWAKATDVAYYRIVVDSDEEFTPDFNKITATNANASKGLITGEGSAGDPYIIPLTAEAGQNGTVGIAIAADAFTNDGGGSDADSSNTFTVDTTPPVISVSPQIVNLNLGDPAYNYNTGASVSDNLDSGVSLSITGTANTGSPGTYYINYNATDAAGNAATQVTRTIIVTDPHAGKILTNLLTNGSCETGTPPSNWNYVAVGTIALSRASLPAANPNSSYGSYACRLANPSQSNNNGSTLNLSNTPAVSVINAHKYFITAQVRMVTNIQTVAITNGGTALSNLEAGSTLVAATPTANTWITKSGVWTATSNTTFTLQFVMPVSNGNNVKDIYIDNVMMIDLTAAYGAGNEPNLATMNALINSRGKNGYWDGSWTIGS